MKFKLAFLLLTIFSINSLGSTTAKIDKILLYEYGDMVYIYPTGGVYNPPACHGSNGDYLSFKMSRPMAKEYLSLLMMAFAAQKTVSFRTANACIDQSVSETIQYITINN